MRCVRVVAVPTADNNFDQPIHLDVFIDGNNKVIGDQPIFGMQGKFGLSGAPISFPFVIYPNQATLDFGSNTEDARVGRFDLLDGSVTIGRILTLNNAHGSQKYRIGYVTDLPIA